MRSPLTRPGKGFGQRQEEAATEGRPRQTQTGSGGQGGKKQPPPTEVGGIRQSLTQVYAL